MEMMGKAGQLPMSQSVEIFQKPQYLQIREESKLQTKEELEEENIYSFLRLFYPLIGHWQRYSVRLYFKILFILF